jgi:tRNA(Met) cytidine acetyltransferase
MDELLDLTAQMAREGVRRLLVLSGDDAWTQAGAGAAYRAGRRWLWVGPRRCRPYVSPAP